MMFTWYSLSLFKFASRTQNAPTVTASTVQFLIMVFMTLMTHNSWTDMCVYLCAVLFPPGQKKAHGEISQPLRILPTESFPHN